MPPSWFTLDPKEVDQLFKCLAGIKVSSRYCGKISRYLDTKKKVQLDEVSRLSCDDDAVTPGCT